MISIRASSLGELLECALRWEAKHIRGLRLPTGPAAAIGTAIHAGSSIYDGGGRSEEAMAAAVEYAISCVREPNEEVDWQGISPKAREQRTITGLAAYSQIQREYTEIEIQLDPVIIDVDGFEIELTGTADRIRYDAGRVGVTDIKTGAAAVSADGTVKAGPHGPQLGVYHFMAEQMLGMELELAPEIIGVSTTSGRAGAAEIPTAKDQFLGTHEHRGYIEFAAGMLKSGLFHPNPRSTLCDKKYCPNWQACPFHP